MVTTIKEFRPHATPEQGKVLDRLMVLNKQEVEAYELAQNKQREINVEFSRARSEWGTQTDMVYADMEFFADDLVVVRDSNYRAVESAQAEMRELLQRGVSKLGMAHLGFFQRQYQRLLGQPIPSKYLIAN